jgi:hypothetical protein
MRAEQFWEIVDEAQRVADNSQDRRVDELRRILSTETVKELQSFQQHYDEHIRQSYRWDLWEVAYIINGGCSDDGFRFFRDWLISEGRATFETALVAPESLAKLPKIHLAELELFGYVACELFEAKSGGKLDRYFSTEISKPAGEEWSEADLAHMFPVLVRVYS